MVTRRLDMSAAALVTLLDLHTDFVAMSAPRHLGFRTFFFFEDSCTEKLRPSQTT